MSEAVKIAIIVEGGIVQDVLSAGVPVEFVVVDYDTDGAAPSDVVSVPQGGLAASMAYVSAAPMRAEQTDVSGAFVLAAFERFGAE